MPFTKSIHRRSWAARAWSRSIPVSRPGWTAFWIFLRARGRLGEFGFFSFGGYPFVEGCAPTASQLVESPDLITAAHARFSENETLRRIPWLVTEYGYSAFG